MPDSAVMAALVRRSVRIATPLAQAYAEADMLSQVRITRVGDKPGFDRATGKPTPGSTIPIYEGNAHIYKVSGGATYELGEEQQTASQTYISIPVASDRPQSKDDVEVLADADPELVGRRFRVDDVEVGGLIPAVRRMAVTGIEPAPNTASG